MWDFVCLSLEISNKLFFFPFLFVCYCCLVDPCVVSIFSCHCNYTFFALFYAVFKSSCRCIDTIFFPLFLTHTVGLCHFLDAMPYASLIIFLFWRPFEVLSSTSWMVQSLISSVLWHINRSMIYIYIYIYIYILNIRGTFKRFTDFFRMGTFIDSTRMKLQSPSR